MSAGAGHRQDEFDEADAAELSGWQATGTDGAALRTLASERLAAHRTRRARAQAEVAAAQADQRAVQARRGGASRAAQSAARQAVAQRYASSPSYHDFLAEEAERAIAQAQAEAEVAARNARAVAAAQMQLLGELEQWRETGTSPRTTVLAAQQQDRRNDLADAVADIAQAATELLMASPAASAAAASAAAIMSAGSSPAAESPAAARIELVNALPAAAPPALTQLSSVGVTVRLYEELGMGLPALADLRSGAAEAASPTHTEAAALDAEIDFRREPQFADFRVETVAIPGNVIEFPRPVVASRKARPRRAEGPLLEDLLAGAAAPQLRIFEVDAEQATATPASEPLTAPEWQSLMLSAHVPAEPLLTPDAPLQPASTAQAATVPLRLMAAAVDAAILGGAFVAFVAAACEVIHQPLRGAPPAVLAGTAAAVLLGMTVGYLLLFFTFAEATPGMLYARIGLCTLGERNPTRRELLRRVPATLLAAAPLGLGLLWVLLDEERLGWHDRVSRMYQRAY